MNRTDVSMRMTVWQSDCCPNTVMRVNHGAKLSNMQGSVIDLTSQFILQFVLWPNKESVINDPIWVTVNVLGG